MKIDYEIKQRKPYVTELLDLLNKPALLNWANKIGLEGITLEDARQKSMLAGTSLHKQAENWLKDKTLFEDLKFGENFISFFKDKEVLETEKVVRCEHFVGRIDLKFRHEGKVFISDLKSNKKNIYLENRLQLTAYKMCEPCDEVSIISIPSMKVLNPKIQDYTPYESILIKLAELYKLKQIVDPYQPRQWTKKKTEIPTQLNLEVEKQKW